MLQLVKCAWIYNMSLQASRDLVCFLQLDHVNVYYGQDYRSKYKAPTDYCLALKVITDQCLFRLWTFIEKALNHQDSLSFFVDADDGDKITFVHAGMPTQWQLWKTLQLEKNLFLKCYGLQVLVKQQRTCANEGYLLARIW